MKPELRKNDIVVWWLDTYPLTWGISYISVKILAGIRVYWVTEYPDKKVECAICEEEYTEHFHRHLDVDGINHLKIGRL